MQEVSEAAGVSRATLYRYFPSKDHLMDAVAVFDEHTFNEGLAVALAATAEPRNGTGATARPVSSATTAASRYDAPAPPLLSGISRPAQPSSAASTRQRPVS